MGLDVDKDPGSPLFRLMPDDLAPLKNMLPTRATLLARAEAAILTHGPRANGPTRLEEVSDGQPDGGASQMRICLSAGLPP